MQFKIKCGWNTGWRAFVIQRHLPHRQTQHCQTYRVPLSQITNATSQSNCAQQKARCWFFWTPPNQLFLYLDNRLSTVLTQRFEICRMWSVWMFTIPALRARECTSTEKDALNILFLLIPLLNVTLPLVWKSFPFIFTADCLAMGTIYLWKIGLPNQQVQWLTPD